MVNPNLLLNKLKIHMKKLILLSLVLCAAFLSIKAQPCVTKCSYGPLQTKSIAICKLTTPLFSYPPGNPPTQLIDVPLVSVIFNYRVKICQGKKTLFIEEYVVVDNTVYWETDVWQPGGQFQGPQLQLVSTGAVTCSGSINHPVSIGDYPAIVAEATLELLTLENASQNNYFDVVFPGSCFSLVLLEFPAGSFLTTGPDDNNQYDTLWLSQTGPVVQAIPCNDACCVISFNS